MSGRLRRLLKHRWLDESAARRIIPQDLLQRLAARVSDSEQRHMGEIRIFVEGSLPLSYLLRKAPLPAIIRQRAVTMFGKLRVWDTEYNNGVLIYLLLAERAIEIVADRGLNHVQSDHWQNIISRMREAFQAGDFESGLNQAVAEVEALLVQRFPRARDQVRSNELPDEPILG